MVRSVVPKQRREIAVPPPLTSKAAAVPRRAVECAKKKEGVGLADLRDVDKAKVARLINHGNVAIDEFGIKWAQNDDRVLRSEQVMMAFKEVHRMKELLELERCKHEALVSKLQQQNQEVTAVVSQLRLKLASLQLKSPLPPQKAYLHSGRRLNLSPIREAECSEAESETMQSPAFQSSEETASILRERENLISDFKTTAGGKVNGPSNKFQGTEQYDETIQTEGCQASNSQAGTVSEPQGKENKDPECSQQCKGDTHTPNEEDSGVLRKRPPPRPLPDLLSNILQRCKGIGSVPIAADQSEPSVKLNSKGDPLNASVSILQGNLKPTAPQPPPQLAQASCSHGLQNAPTSLCGDHVGYALHGPHSEAAMPGHAVSQQSHAEAGVDFNGLGNTIRTESGGRDALGCKQLEEGGQRQEAVKFMAPTQCVGASFHQCQPNCSEPMGEAEKAGNELCNQENVMEPKPCASQKKLRFDPTAGEEGIFYYASDVQETGKENQNIGSLQQAGRTTEPLPSSVPPVEGHRLDRDTLQSHWTPEAIERRNSFHRIPVVSPSSTDSTEEHSDAQKRLFSDAVSHKHPQTRVANTEEREQLATSESESLSIRNGQSHPQKSRRSLHRPSKCITCLSYVPWRSKRALLSTKHFAKLPQRCSKCSSIVEPKAPARRFGETKRCREHVARSDRRPSKGKSEKQNKAESSVDTSDCGGEDGLIVSDPSSSANTARCGDFATRIKSRSSRPLPQNPRRGQAGRRPSVPVEEEGSDQTSTVYCVTSEDMYMSTHSSPTDHSLKARRHAPTFPLRVCRIHTRKIKKKRGGVREMKSVKVLRDQSSDPTEEVFHVNRDVLDMLLQSNGKHRRPAAAPLGESTECRIETWRFKKPHRGLRRKSTEEEGMEQIPSGSLVQEEDISSGWNPRAGLALRPDGRQRARRHDHHQRRKHSTEKWKHFEVDELLDRFMQSNAECAAELIKCSVYFESTSASSRPSSQSTLFSNRIASRLPFQNLTAAEQHADGGIVSPRRERPRRELFIVDHNGQSSAQPFSEKSVQCSKCGVCMKFGGDLPLVGAHEMAETKGLRDLCDTCSASVTPEKTHQARRADERRRRADVPAPIVLPRVNVDDALRNPKVVRVQKAGGPPRSSTVQICNVTRSEDWASERLQDAPDLSTEVNRMPIITGVSVNSRRSTSPREMEEADKARGLTEMFDMSLYDLVNDLEGQRRDYWKRVNGHSMDEESRHGRQWNGGRRRVAVNETQRPPSTIRHRKLIHANHFR